MKSLMTPEAFKANIDGFNIVDCVVRSREILYLLGREDYTSWPTEKWDPESMPPPAEDQIQKRVYPVMLEKPGDKMFSNMKLTGFDLAQIGLSRFPKEQCVVMTLEGEVYAMGSGEAGIEDNLKSWRLEKGPRRGGVHKMRTIDGWLYFCMGNRGVGKRLGKNDWLHFNDQIPDPPEESNSFDDIDGFSESDIYCVGNAGNVWHFDGKAWRQLDFPSNIHLESVVCAGDGQVYISGAQGTIFKGRGQRWQRIHEGSMSLPFKDLVWYEDRVWATSDYGVWQIHNDKLQSAELPDYIGNCAGNLSVGDGVLLLAGYGGAAFLRDGKWTRIFSAGAMQQELSKPRTKK
ncbi:hypothetical protein [Mitsuaria sp. GD03876]|uniref:WD40/YVTN/BNR-like repeat-containing protein n=1 Tax=Mitsuaria sp. GD03876 TaxID=2975399 RepID=UPI0024494BEE|nr:hypothetical protein [Mitsuaria sp. GD03876]MDH0868134.1 hypothetical protein [Mitsuaria sp. GD03876]